MRPEKTTLLFTLVAALMAAPVFAADADAAKGSMEDAQQPAATATDADTTKSADDQYVVEKGDTLAEIAKRKLGSEDEWEKIAHANGIDDPKALRVGQRLSIPSKSTDDPQRKL